VQLPAVYSRPPQKFDQEKRHCVGRRRFAYRSDERVIVLIQIARHLLSDALRFAVLLLRRRSTIVKITAETPTDSR